MRKSSLTLTAAAMVLVAGWVLADEAKKAAIGQAAPAFSLKDTAGKDVTLSNYSGKIVVLEWVNPECPFVQRHYRAGTMTRLAEKYKDKDVVWLPVASGATAGKASLLSQFVADQKLSNAILLDPERHVAQAYGAKTTPHMFIIDKEGKLVYAGGIDDDAGGKKGEQAVNYVDKALTQILAGESVSQAESKPYGCTLK